jgi:hypothetical protein
MIDEAIQKLMELAPTQEHPKELIKFQDSTVYAVPKTGGWDITHIERKPRRPQVSVDGVDDAIELAGKIAEPETAIWVLGRSFAGLYFNRADEASLFVIVPFQLSDAWVYLLKPEWKPHREFLSFIRRAMPFMPSTFNAVVKNLKIEKTDAVDSEATATSAAMGKRFTVKASGAGDLPEAVNLGFKPFHNIDHRASVQCVFEIDFERGMMRLAPIDGEIEGNLATIHESIRQEIIKANEKWLVVSGKAS